MITTLAATLASNLAGLRTRIAAAQKRAPSGPRALSLVAVTKSVGPELAAELVQLGQRELGESRIDELERKSAWFTAHGIQARWHFLGNVQRNKARRIVQQASVVHSLDSLELAATFERLCAELERELEVFVQVKLWPEANKGGVAPAELEALLERLRACPHLKPAGLMCIAPLFPDDQPTQSAQAARQVFGELSAIARGLAANPRTQSLFQDGRVRTSMGMSQDFELAIEAGSDLVRVGSLLFDDLAPEVQERA